MRVRRLAVAAVAAASMALAGCGVAVDSTGQVCVIVLGIPICQSAS